MPGLSYQMIVAFCELLSAKLKPLLGEMPHLQEESTNLDGMIVELKSLSHKQEDLKGRLREMTRLRREAEQRSQELRSRIVAQLRGKLGFTNENLIAFGINPRKTRRRATQPPEEKPAADAKPPATDAPTASSILP